ncbi:glycerophosphoryl diester phosphodiesterase [Paenibacillus sp. PastF-1]|uniref:glycerophosphodiester phosphodiesterase n=1 Tax=unclassified Paenibacillus TaxID=185978 RepID=UPI002404ACC0|nr:MULTISPECIES: glycerophosphodiester phosphodiesterase [unclassified Paenibacillus]MDF9839407.1 glycerophosphoryl diester phosphodiesterase [Paenibacillus sp. PastF-2]MDF9845987.1 glycerophosphoryl diester phosphodiesterase [Paenibacillus sp. PastM-2]MDF9852560.1 glycerophosphoryl diester phosphodiesterase [Paenibacillus sp. PastF-1]MDH6477710.1 glycerophosphoryl diester phosphodiesterase [Paenibacillus sp. PastH-2]MDH6505449.1 glycerophosphoryl diester phosphodiesterase [Paenibacillus sp. P
MTKMFRHKAYFIGVHVLMFIFLFSALYAYFPWIRVKVKEIINPADKVLTIAHRGASGYAPENTIPAIELAIEMQADYIELDIHLTKDKIPVVIHDETVNRTTGSRGYVKNMTLEQIKQLDAGSWFNEAYPMFAREQYAGITIPTLDEVFETFGDKTRYMIEIKEPGVNSQIEALLNEAIEKYKLEDVVSVHSFSSASLRKLHALNPEIPLYQLVWYDYTAVRAPVSYLENVKTYAVGISPNFQGIGAAYVAQVKNAGLKVMPYTVNYQVNMDKAYLWGVDGVYTNYPDRFQEVIDTNRENGQW